MHHSLYEQDHEDYRMSIRAFIARSVSPQLDEWRRKGLIARDLWRSAGANGVIGISCPTELGGAGAPTDFRFRLVVFEEFARAHAGIVGATLALQDDLAIPYVLRLGNEEQKKRWLPEICAGDSIFAVAMTEPDIGSDLRSMRTTASRVEGGWRLSGSKTFITCGVRADVVITAARTSSEGLSLFLVPRSSAGFTSSEPLTKLGRHEQDTASLAYDDVFVPEDYLLGKESAGLGQLLSLLPYERMSIAAQAQTTADVVLQDTVRYTSERKAFGKRIIDFQNTRFELASIATELDASRALLHQSVLALNAGSLSAVDAAKAKLFATEVQFRSIDRCLQLFGGYGYMTEYPVANEFADARVLRILGGSSEIMREVIGRDLAQPS